MDYEQKYKDCLNRAKAWAEGTVQLDDSPQGVIEYVFPELAESEEERVRKEIISFIQDHIDEINLQVSGDYDTRDKEDIALQEWCKEAIAWLEKQKEYESTDFDYVWERTDCGDLTAALDKYSEDAIKKMCHAWYDKGIELERKSWLEKQGELKSSKWAEGDVVRHGGILALVTNGRKAMKSNREQITIQYPDEWVKAETKERKYFFDELEKQGKNLSCGMDVVPPEPSTSTVVTGSKGKQDEQKPADKCVGCNNVKGCVTCVDGSEWAHISEQKPAWSEEKENKVMDEKQSKLCEKCMNAPINSKERAQILTECRSQSCWYKGY